VSDDREEGSDVASGVIVPGPVASIPLGVCYLVIRRGQRIAKRYE
jgi:hypothetical protein